MIIRTHNDFVEWLTGLAIKTFPGPRLSNPRAQIEERAAARRLVEAGYKAGRIKSIWAFTRQHTFFASKVNSVQGLASALLSPPNSNWLEADYDVWLAAHPPMCPHGRPLELKDKCPGCQSDPNCPHHCTDGVTTERVIEETHTDMMFICDCAAAKIGVPPLAEQIKIQREKIEKRKPLKPEADAVL